MNYFDLVETIKTVSLIYSQEFYEGDVYEFLNSGNHKYPSVILTVQNITTDDNINSVSATLFCVDRLTDNADNKLEIQSLCMTNLSKIIDSLEYKITNLTTNTYTPFTEKFADLCGGMFVEFSFQYVGESLCDDLEIKEIELTQNGIYDVIGYDRAIVNVRPVVNLEDITITDNGEYTCGEGFDGFGKVNVDLRGKVKVNSFKVTNDCINKEGRWKGDTLIDTSECTSFSGIFQGNTKIKQLDCQHWNTSKITSLQNAFWGCTSIKELDLSNWNVDNVTICVQTFLQCVNLEYIKGLENWHTDRVTNYQYIFQNCYKLKELNLTNWYAGGLPSSSYITGFITNCYELTTLIGGATIEEVLANNISCMNGLKVSFVLVSSQNQKTKLDRASLRALINGLAEVETTKTLTLGATLMAKLTEEDIAIATNKGWTIA